MPPSVDVRGSLLARNTLLNLVGRGLPLLVALFAIPLLAQGLGAARFGLLALVLMVLGLVAEVGFGRATTKFVAEALGRGDHDALPGITWTTVALQVGVGLLLGGALALLAPLIATRVLEMPLELVEEARAALLVVAVTLPVVLASSALRGVLEAAQRFELVNLISVPVSSATFLMPLLGMALGWGLGGIMVLVALARLSGALAYGWTAVRLFPVLLRRITVERGQLRRVAGFGGWISVSSVVSPVLHYMDRLALGALVAVAAVGYYTPPFELATRLLILPAALVVTLFPAFSTLTGRADVERTRALAARSLHVVLLVMAPVAVLLAVGAGPLLEVWVGPEYAREGALALRILLTGVVVNALAYVPVSLLQGMGRPDLPARFHLAELPLQALLVWILVPWWGIPGAALAWSLRVAVDSTLLLGAVVRLGVLRWDRLVAERVPRTLAMVAAFAAAQAASTALAPGPFWSGGVAAVLAGALAVAVWHWSLGEGDRLRLAGLVPGLGGR